MGWGSTPLLSSSININMQTTNLLPDMPTKIGVMVSGGLDSALLLYLLTKENKQKGYPHEIIALTVYKTDNSEGHSKRIVSTIEIMLDTTISTSEVGPNVGMPLHEIILSIIDKNIVPLLYEGSNAIHESLMDSSPPVRYISPYDTIKQPWAYTTKDAIVKYILDEKLYELINMSHSCGRRDRDSGQCGTCYNCIERAWAFKQNNAQDTGTY